MTVGGDIRSGYETECGVVEEEGECWVQGSVGGVGVGVRR